MKKIPLPDLTPYAEKLGVTVHLLKKVLRERKKPLSAYKNISDELIEAKKIEVHKLASKETFGKAEHVKRLADYKKAENELQIMCLKKLARQNNLPGCEKVWYICPDSSISEELAVLKMAKLSKMRSEIRKTAKLLPSTASKTIIEYVRKRKNCFYKNTEEPDYEGY